MELRDYQIRSIQKIRDAYKNGYKRPILRLDCGAGKTITSAWMAIESAQKGNEVLFLVHRKELLDQTYESFKSLNADMERIKIDMVITVGNHLENYNPNFIIADECNFALSKTWRKVLDHYQNAYVLGLSATPARLDGLAMGDVFDKIIEDVDANELIKMKRLAPYEYYAPVLDIDLSNIGIRNGDYKQEELEQSMMKSKIYGDVIKYYSKFTNLKSIVYCTTIKHAQDTARIFNENGYKAKSIDSNLSKSERDSIINEFRNNEIDILCNCDLISFGFDVPDCNAVILLRPTQSVSLFIQQSMRSMRYQENKTAYILDFVGNCYRHGLPTDTRSWTLDGRIRTNNPSGEPDVLARQCEACHLVYAGIQPICPYCGHDNKKTRQQIKIEHDTELERVESIKRIEKRREQGRAKTLDELLTIERERGYKRGWAYNIIRNRGK